MAITTELVKLDEITVDDGLNLRKDYGDMAVLRESIRNKGLEQPVTVRRKKRGGFMLVSGFRRRQCVEDLGLKSIDAIIKPASMTVAEALLSNFMENVARKNLNPMEEAEGVGKMMEQGMDRTDIENAMGWSKAMFTMRHKLLKYSIAIQDALRDGEISVAQAQLVAKLPIDDHEKFVEMAKKMMTSAFRAKVEKELGGEGDGEGDSDSSSDSSSESGGEGGTEEDPEAAEMKEQEKAARGAIKKVLRSLSKTVGLDPKEVKLIDLAYIDLDGLNALATILDNVEEQFNGLQETVDSYEVVEEVEVEEETAA